MGLILHHNLNTHQQAVLTDLGLSLRLQPFANRSQPPTEPCLVVAGNTYWRPDQQSPVAACATTSQTAKIAWHAVPCVCWLDSLPTNVGDAFWNGWDGIITPTHQPEDVRRIVGGLLQRSALRQQALAQAAEYAPPSAAQSQHALGASDSAASPHGTG